MHDKPIKMEFTAQERRAIDTAFVAIEYLCEASTWTHAPAWRAAISALRKDGKPVCKWELRSRIIGAWYKGATDWQQNRALHDCPIDWAPWYVQTWILGALVTRDNQANHKAVHLASALAACPPAIAAYERARAAWGDKIVGRCHAQA